jgi:DNA-binding NarL/FixJ family response regulator
VLYLQQRKGEFEIPRRERFVDRSLLADLFSPGQFKSERNHEIIRAHLHCGYTQQEIAVQCGLLYSTVSRIIEGEGRKSNGKT